MLIKINLIILVAYMQINELKPKSASTMGKYQQFLNSVYTNIKEKQFSILKSSKPENQLFFNKISTKDTFQGLGTIDEVGDNNKNGKQIFGKSSKFKNFLNVLDEEQKKISVNNMNLLGLEVRKVSYCEKQKRRNNKHLIDFLDQNIDEGSQSKISLKRTLNCETVDQLMNYKMGIRHRQILGRSSLSKRHSFVTKQKPKTSKSEFKRKASPDFQNPIYENRINSYKDLIFKLQFVHGFYIETERDLEESFVFRHQKKYKCWVGSGNNANLIKALLKRRFWWTVSDEKSTNVNFIWTQLRNLDFMQKQNPTCLWIRDTSKVWGRNSDVTHPPKHLLKKRKRKSIFFEEKQAEDYNHKILVQQDNNKLFQLNNRLSNKCFREKQQILQLQTLDNQKCKMHNHLINNFYLGNKKALFYNLKHYYELMQKNVFTKLPLTFHIKKGFKDMQYKRFMAYYKRRAGIMKKFEKDEGSNKVKQRNIWIVKPGEITNRGHGITVIDEIYQLNHIIKRQGKHENGTEKTFIVQLYLDRPLLYQRRKFDIRHFVLITHINGLMRAYWFKEGYLRTSGYEFDISNFEREIHLTNDAVQKHTGMYGKMEPANKVSYAQFQRYLDLTFPKKRYNFQKQIIPEMKSICLDAVKSSYLKLSPKRIMHNFEIFGLDFMIDDSFKPWLIEINTNPCLEISCPLLNRIIPEMVDQALRLSLDVVFPPPCNYPNTCKHLAPQAHLQNLNYQLIFDEKRDGGEIRCLYKKQNIDLLEQIGQMSDDETYQDNGKQISSQNFL